MEPSKVKEIVRCCVRLHNICMRESKRERERTLSGCNSYMEQEYVAEELETRNNDSALRTRLVQAVRDGGWVRAT
eukprot:3290337-Pyramimonas_sp.AAC.1